MLFNSSLESRNRMLNKKKKINKALSYILFVILFYIAYLVLSFINYKPIPDEELYRDEAGNYY